MCSTSLRRKHPWNILALIAFTVVESVLVGCICSYWDVGVVLEAFAVTCAAVGGLTLMAIFGERSGGWVVAGRGGHVGQGARAQQGPGAPAVLAARYAARRVSCKPKVIWARGHTGAQGYQVRHSAWRSPSSLVVHL